MDGIYVNSSTAGLSPVYGNGGVLRGSQEVGYKGEVPRPLSLQIPSNKPGGTWRVLLAITLGVIVASSVLSSKLKAPIAHGESSSIDSLKLIPDVEEKDELMNPSSPELFEKRSQSGTVEEHSQSGTFEEHSQSGTFEEHSQSGTFEEHSQSGTFEEHSQSGTFEEHSQSGTVEEHSQSGTVSASESTTPFGLPLPGDDVNGKPGNDVDGKNLLPALAPDDGYFVNAANDFPDAVGDGPRKTDDIPHMQQHAFEELYGGPTEKHHPGINDDDETSSDDDEESYSDDDEVDDNVDDDTGDDDTPLMNEDSASNQQDDTPEIKLESNETFLSTRSLVVTLPSPLHPSAETGPQQLENEYALLVAAVNTADGPSAVNELLDLAGTPKLDEAKYISLDHVLSGYMTNRKKAILESAKECAARRQSTIVARAQFFWLKQEYINLKKYVQNTEKLVDDKLLVLKTLDKHSVDLKREYLEVETAKTAYQSALVKEVAALEDLYAVLSRSAKEMSVIDILTELKDNGGAKKFETTFSQDLICALNNPAALFKAITSSPSGLTGLAKDLDTARLTSLNKKFSSFKDALRMMEIVSARLNLTRKLLVCVDPSSENVQNFPEVWMHSERSAKEKEIEDMVRAAHTEATSGKSEYRLNPWFFSIV